jgi:hypothetical protein
MRRYGEVNLRPPQMRNNVEAGVINGAHRQGVGSGRKLLKLQMRWGEVCLDFRRLGEMFLG